MMKELTTATRKKWSDIIRQVYSVSGDCNFALIVRPSVPSTLLGLSSRLSTLDTNVRYIEHRDRIRRREFSIPSYSIMEKLKPNNSELSSSSVEENCQDAF